MNKQQLLAEISRLSSEGIVSRSDVLHALGSASKADRSLYKQASVADVLYFIGGAIVVIGISVFLWQNWDALNPFARITSTLGSGLAAYVIGMLFGRESKLDTLSQAFFLISAAVIPTGLYVTFHEIGYQTGTSGFHTVISAAMLLMYLASFILSRRTIFLIFTIIFASWFYFALTSFIVGDNPMFGEKFVEYRVLLLGLSYMLLGYHWSKTDKSELTGALYGFGSIAFLGAALALGGWSPSQNVFWELVFPGLVFLMILLSVDLKSKTFLIFGSIFLMIYILKITSEYFTNSLGWPLALIIAGLALIAVGYLSFHINQKYIKNP